MRYLISFAVQGLQSYLGDLSGQKERGLPNFYQYRVIPNLGYFKENRVVLAERVAERVAPMPARQAEDIVAMIVCANRPKNTLVSHSLVLISIPLRTFWFRSWRAPALVRRFNFPTQNLPKSGSCRLWGPPYGRFQLDLVEGFSGGFDDALPSHAPLYEFLDDEKLHDVLESWPESPSSDREVELVERPIGVRSLL